MVRVARLILGGFLGLTLGLALPSYNSAIRSARAHGAEHGGQIQKIGAYEAELVVKGKEVSLYLTDKDEKKPAAGQFKASVMVLAADGQKTIELVPASGNRLSGQYDFAVAGKFRATVTLAGPSGEIGKGRYNLDLK
jgi:hypothetical protein